MWVESNWLVRAKRDEKKKTHVIQKEMLKSTNIQWNTERKIIHIHTLREGKKKKHQMKMNQI